MDQKKIDRINALAQKSRTPEGLTQAEKEEQGELRQAYIASVKQSLTGQLEHTYVVDREGHKTKLKKRD